MATYLERLIGRTGAPANAELAPEPPPLPAIFDPFADDAGIELAAPAPTDPPRTEAAALGPPPAEPGEARAAPMPSVTTISVEPDVSDAPIPVAQAVRRDIEPLAPPPTPVAPSLEEARPDSRDGIEPPDRIERIVTLEPPVPPAIAVPEPPAEAAEAPEPIAAALPLPPLRTEPVRVEPVIEPGFASVVPEAPVMLMPPDEPLPAAHPDLSADTQPPQITIGDIVVEIVARPEQARPPSSVRPSRPVARPAAPRQGVRSKRGYGIGQT